MSLTILKGGGLAPLKLRTWKEQLMSSTYDYVQNHNPPPYWTIGPTLQIPNTTTKQFLNESILQSLGYTITTLNPEDDD